MLKQGKLCSGKKEWQKRFTVEKQVDAPFAKRKECVIFARKLCENWVVRANSTKI